MKNSDTCLFPQTIITHTCSLIAGLLLLSLTGCGIGNEEGIAGAQGAIITTTATATGATASLIWDPVNDSSVTGYYIHYGKQSPNQPGSCAYDHVQFAPAAQSTVNDLDLGSTYYFAVSAYNGLEGDCSNEVSANT